jgi:tetratricopeptide (TPR) repeat protein
VVAKRKPRPGAGRSAYGSLVLLTAASLLAGVSGCSSLRESAPPRAPLSLLDAGDMALANGEAKEAMRHFDQALEIEPESARALLGKARSLIALGKGESSLDYFTRYAAVETGPWPPHAMDDYCSALTLAALQAIDRDDPSRGLRLGRRLPRSECREPRQREIVMRSQLGLAEHERAVGQNDRALARYRVVLEQDSAVSTKTSGRRAARAVEPGANDELQAKAYKGAAELLLEAGDRRQALEILSEGVGRFPRDRELLELMVAVLADPDS